jgi:hypothetical protein
MTAIAGTALAQAKIEVGAEDLLVNPVGANWISYNGDYSGRR